MEDFELTTLNKQVPVTKSICSKTRKEDIKKRLQNYTKKKSDDPFIHGQKYYVLDEKIPNCVHSIVCNQSFTPKDTHSSLGKDKFGDLNFKHHTCSSYDAKYNTGNEIKQLDTLANDDTITKIEKRKYKYQLDNPNVEIYYRKCPLFGCKSGTSLLEVTGGKTKRNRNRNRNRKLRK